MKLKKSDKLRRELYCSLLNLFELKYEFALLPFDIRESFFNFTWPKVKVEVNGEHPYAESVQNNIKNQFQNNFMEINGQEVAINKFHGIFALYSYFHSLNVSMASYLKKEDAHHNKKLKQIERIFHLSLKILNKIDERLKIKTTDYLDKISMIASQETFKYFSLDEIGLYPEFLLKYTEAKKKYPAVVINVHGPKQKTLKLDGDIRIGYECPCFLNGKIQELIWKENIIENEVPIKVYIQDHAIKRVFERCSVGSYNGYIYDSILRSLENPIVNGKDGPSYLIEYKYYSVKLGYLLVTKEKDFAIVRTFKFITMVGTPEFYMLRRALKGTKEDFEYLGIDSMEILLNSDIFKDSVLSSLFKRCGMSDLVNLGKKIEFQKPKNMIAEEIKNYFRI
jgi:hypothetical protein